MDKLLQAIRSEIDKVMKNQWHDTQRIRASPKPEETTRTKTNFKQYNKMRVLNLRPDELPEPVVPTQKKAEPKAKSPVRIIPKINPRDFTDFNDFLLKTDKAGVLDGLNHKLSTSTSQKEIAKQLNITAPISSKIHNSKISQRNIEKIKDEPIVQAMSKSNSYLDLEYSKLSRKMSNSRIDLPKDPSVAKKNSQTLISSQPSAQKIRMSSENGFSDYLNGLDYGEGLSKPQDRLTTSQTKTDPLRRSISVHKDKPSSMNEKKRTVIENREQKATTDAFDLYLEDLVYEEERRSMDNQRVTRQDNQKDIRSPVPSKSRLHLPDQIHEDMNRKSPLKESNYKDHKQQEKRKESYPQQPESSPLHRPTKKSEPNTRVETTQEHYLSIIDVEKPDFVAEPIEKSVFAKTSFIGQKEVGEFKPSFIQLVEEESLQKKKSRFKMAQKLFDEYKNNKIVRAIVENHQPHATGKLPPLKHKCDFVPKTVGNETSESNKNDNQSPQRLVRFIDEKQHSKCYTFLCTVEGGSNQACPKSFDNQTQTVNGAGNKVNERNRNNNPNYIISRYMEKQNDPSRDNLHRTMKSTEKTMHQTSNSRSKSPVQNNKTAQNFGTIENVIHNKGLFNALIGSKKLSRKEFEKHISIQGDQRGINEQALVDARPLIGQQTNHSINNSGFRFETPEAQTHSEAKVLPHHEHHHESQSLKQVNRNISIDDYLRVKSEALSKISENNLEDYFDEIQNSKEQKKQTRAQPSQTKIHSHSQRVQENNDQKNSRQKTQDDFDSSNYLNLGQTDFMESQRTAIRSNAGIYGNKKHFSNEDKLNDNNMQNFRRNISSPDHPSQLNGLAKFNHRETGLNSKVRQEVILSDIGSDNSSYRVIRDNTKAKTNALTFPSQRDYDDDSQSYLANKSNPKNIEIYKPSFENNPEQRRMTNLEAPGFFLQDNRIEDVSRNRFKTEETQVRPIDNSDDYYVNKDGLKIPKVVKHMTTISENVPDYKYAYRSKKITEIEPKDSVKGLHPDIDEYLDNLF